LAGSLLAQGLPPAEAGMAAAYLHGLAARVAAAGGHTEPAGPEGAGEPGQAPIAAFDVITALPAAIRGLDAG
jgi:ADP-dependent NAD(P)H-hydrate dehydratase / NAD(P)H-hydrate epimerase